LSLETKKLFQIVHPGIVFERKRHSGLVKSPFQ
jgi:hypothetical protein